MIEPRNIKAAVTAAGAIMRGEPCGYGLAELLSAQQPYANMANSLFSGKPLQLAALARLLAALKGRDVDAVDRLAAARALRVHAVLAKAGSLTKPEGLGEWHAEFLLGPLLRREFVSLFELANLFGEQDREKTKSTLEAARATCLLDDLIGAFIVVRMRGHTVPLASLCEALCDVIEKERT